MSTALFTVALLSLYGVAALPDGLRGSSYVLVQALLFVLMVACRPHARRSPTRILWWGVALRLLLLPLDPFTTHDVDRYLWDGKLLLEGIDPYRVAPTDDRVSALLNAWPVAPEHRKYVTLYPPLAVVLFASAAAAGPSFAPLVWSGLTTLFSVALLIGLSRLLKRIRRAEWIHLAAFNPLLLCEAGVGKHLDVVPAAFTVWALVAYMAHRHRGSGVLLGLGTLGKLTPVLLLLPLLPLRSRARNPDSEASAAQGPPDPAVDPAAWTLRPSWAHWSRTALFAVTTIALGYGATVALDLRPIGSTSVFLTKWRFFSLIGFLPEGPIRMTVGALSFVGLLGVATVYRERSRRQALSLALLAPLLASPVLFPWYLLPAASVAIVYPEVFTWMLVGLAPFTYEVLDGFESGNGWMPHPLLPIVALLLALVLALPRARTWLLQGLYGRDGTWAEEVEDRTLPL